MEAAQKTEAEVDEFCGECGAVGCCAHRPGCGDADCELCASERVLQ